MILPKEDFVKHCIWEALQHAALYSVALLLSSLMLLADADAQEPPQYTPPTDAFVTTWATTGTNATITIPTFNGDTYNYNVDCNSDGIDELTGQTTDATCTYATAGTHTVVITGAFPRIYFNGGGDKNKIRSVAQWGTQVWTSMERAFRAVGEGTGNSFAITATDAPVLTSVTNMANMFESTSSFTGTHTNMSAWDVSNVTILARTFSGAHAFNGDIRNWNVSKVTTLFHTFANARAFNQDISGWRPGADANTVFTSLSNAFNGAGLFNSNLGDWDVSRVTNFTNTFSGVSLSTANYEGLLIGWAAQDLQDVKTLDVGTAQYCSLAAATARASIEADDRWMINDGGISSSCPPQFMATVSDQSYTMGTAISLTLSEATGGAAPLTYTLTGPMAADLPDNLSFNATNRTLSGTPTAIGATTLTYTVTDANSASSTVTFVVTINSAAAVTPPTDAFVTTWATTGTNATITIPTFNGDTYNYNVDCNSDGIDELTGQTTDATCTYATAGTHTVVITGAFPRIYFNGGGDKNKIRSVAQWGTQVWTSMERAFRAVGEGTGNSFAITATDAPVLTSVTNMANMFESTSSFTGTHTNMSAWDVSNVTILARTFSGAHAFNGDIRNWNVSKVTTFFHTFANARAFNQDISGWRPGADANTVFTSLSNAFNGAGLFNSNLGDWDVSRVTNFTNTFSGVSLSTANYEGLLIGWAAQDLQDVKTLDVGTAQYCSLAAATARASIEADDRWMINDGGISSSCPPQFMATVSDQSYTMGTAISLTLSEATGGAAPLTYTLTGPMAADLPDNLSFNATNRTLSGTPTAIGATTLTYTVTDANSASSTVTFVVTVAAGLALSAPSDQSYTMGTAISLTLSEATGGAAPLTYTLTGPMAADLPDNLSFNATNRTLSGTPTAIGATTLTYTVTDANSASSTVTFVVTINSAAAVTPPTDAFVTTWATTGTNATITIPTFNGDTYNYNVDCNSDGIDELTGQTTDATCTYATAGTHTVVITGAFPRIYFNGGGDKNKIRSVAQWGTQVWTSMERAFRAVGEGTGNSFAITATDAPVLTSVTNMANMFESTSSFTGTHTNMSAWDVSNVTILARTFSGAHAFNGDIRNWNVSKVTTLFHTFANARAFNQDISGWRPGADANTVFTSLSNAFNGASLFNSNLGDWDVSRVTNFANTFSGVSLSTANYEGLLIGWAAQDLQDVKTLDVGTAQYCSLAAATARASIEADDRWMINDGGISSSCPPQFMATVSDQSYTMGTAISLTLSEATGGAAPLTYTLTGPMAADLPDNLSFNATNRTLSGTPTAIGATTLTYTVTDANSASSTVTFVVTVAAGLALSAPSDQSYTMGTAISLTLSEATGGAAPLTYTLTGPMAADLPDNLSFNATNRTLSGTPTAIGATTLTYTVTDANSASSTVTFVVTVAAGLALSAPSDQSYTMGTAISLTLSEATGGAAPLTYTLTGPMAADLPDNLSFNATNRTLSGTPTAIGATTLTYTVTDANSASSTVTFVVTVAAGLALSAPSDQSYTMGTAISLTLSEATGGAAPLTYTLTGPMAADLPDNLSFNATNRTLSGTPTAIGATTLTYTVTDANSASSTVTFVVTVAAGLALSAPSDQSYTMGTAISLTLSEATGGAAPLTYTLTGPMAADLPDNLSFNATNRTLSGTPTAIGATTLTYTVTDANSASSTVTFVVTVAAGLALSAPSDQSYTMGTAISLTLSEATGGAAPLTYTLTGPMAADLPDNLSFNATNRTLSGTPTAIGATTLTYTVTDANSASSTVTFVVTVAAGLALSAPSDQSYTMGTAISLTLSEATGGAAPLTYTLTGPMAADLPDNLSFNATNRTLSGTPTAIGATTLTYTVTDANSASSTVTFVVTVAAGLALSAPSDQSYTMGTAISLTLSEATGGAAPLTYTLTGPMAADLPDNLSFNATNRTLSGTPTAIGATTLTYTVTDANSASSTVTFVVTVAAGLALSAPSDQSYTMGTAISLTLSEATGGAAPLTYTLTGPMAADLPDNLSFNATNRTLSGTPTAIGATTLTYTVTDANSASSTVTFVVTINSAAAVTPPTDAFVTTWATTGTNATITIPTFNGDTYNYNVDCNSDGIDELTGQTTDATCTYATAGTHTVVITGAFPRIYFNGGGDKNKIRSVAQWGTQVWTSMERAFRAVGEGTGNSFAITATDAPVLTSVTNMANMFESTSSFTGTHTNMSAWDVSNVTILARTFSGAHAFNGDIRSWNVSKVTTLFHTFANARAFNQDISGWRPGADANTVFTSLSNAFNGAGLFNSNLGDWDVSRVTNFTNTFSGVSLSTANYEGLLIGWAAQDLQDVKTLDVGTAQYCSLAAATARASIEADDRWMINDGGISSSCPPQFMATVSDQSYTMGTAISLTLSEATGGAAPLTYTLTGPMAADLPDNLSFNATNRTLSGTPTAIGATTLTYTVTDANSASSTVTFVVTVAAGLALSAPSDQSYTMGTAISLTLSEATGGAAPLTYTLTGPMAADLPDNLSFNATNRTLSGTPTAIGATTLTYTVTDANSASSTVTFVVTINSAAAVTPPTDAFVTTWATTGTNATITIPTFNGDTYNYNVDCNSDGIDELTGQTTDATCTYATAGTHTVVITGAFPRIYFNGGGDKNKIRSVAQWGTQVWTSMERAFRAVGEGTGNSFAITATDAPVLTSVTNMANMFESTSSFTGTHTNMSAWDVSNVTILARTFSGAHAFNGDIRNWNVSKVTTLFHTFANARAFNQDISGWRPGADANTVFTSLSNAFNGAGLFNSNLGDWDVSRVTNFTNTFSGVSLSTANYEGLLIGWAAQDLQDVKTLDVGTAQYCSLAAATARASIEADDRWMINDGGISSSCPPQFMATVSDQSYTMGTAISLTLSEATGGAAPLTYTLTGPMAADLPDNLSFNATNRTLSGTPTAIGATTLTYTVTDANSASSTVTFVVTVAAGLALSAPSDQSYTMGTAISLTLSEATGGAAPLTYTLTGPMAADLPDNLSFNATNRTLSGTPTAIGATTLTYTVTDANSASSTVTFVVTVAAGLALSAPSDQSYTMGTAISLTLSEATGGAAPLTYTLTGPMAADLPDNLSFNATNRTLSGTPTAIGATTLTYTVTDANSASSTVTFVVTINSAAAVTPPTDAFVTTWATTGTNATITIPTFNGDTYNYNVDCNSDGIDELTGQTTDATCTYATAGTHTVVITGAFPRIYFNGGGDKNKIRSVAQWGTQVWTSMERAFRAVGEGTGNSFAITATDAPVLTSVTNMANMFESTSSFTGTHTNMSAWDVSNVTILARTFSGAHAFNGDIRNWNVSKVTTLFHTFANARAFNQDISGWRPGADANTVFTSLSNAFNGAGLFNSNLGDWDVSRVTNFTNTFSGVSLSTANYEGLLIGWAAQDLQDVKTLDVGTAQYCSLAAATARASIEADDRWMINDGGISSSCPPQFMATVSDQSYTMGTAISLTLSEATGGAAPLTYTLTGPMAADLPDNLSFNATNRTLSGTPTAIGATTLTYTVTDANSASSTVTFVVTINSAAAVTPPTDAFVTTWATTGTNATITIPTFNGDTYNYNVDCNSDGIDELTGQTTDATCTYATAGTHTVVITGAFPRIYFNGGGDKNKIRSVAQWGTQVWTSMERAFRAVGEGTGNSFAITATDAPVLTSVTNMANMFESTSSFTGTHTNMSAWDVSNVTTLARTFSGAHAFNGDIRSWNVSKVTTFFHTFANARAFNQDISGWRPGADANTVFTSLSNAFNGASLFNSNLGDWDVSRVTNFANTFSGVSLSTANYEGLLIGWAAQDLQDVKTLDVGTAQYCSLAAATARASIEADDRWMINDGGISSCSPESPVITSNGGGDSTTIPVKENQTLVTRVMATDANGDVIIYSLSGADTNSFTLDPRSGVLRFNTKPDFEMPASAAAPASNEYRVVVTASDANLSDVQTLTIRVTNVANEELRFTATVGNQTYTVGGMIANLILPEAVGSDSLSYTLTPDLPGGLSFEPSTRLLSGIPTEAIPTGRDYIWRVRDTDSNTDVSISITITINSAAAVTPPTDAFVTTWATTGTNATITIPTFNGDTYNYNVDCNSDGIDELTGQTTDATCTYATAGTHTVVITGAFPRIYFNGGGDKNKIRSVAQWGTQVWTSMERAFRAVGEGTGNSFAITATDAPVLTSVTNMANMFESTSSFTGTHTNMSAWDVSNVTILARTFSGAHAFNGDIRSWNVSKVTTFFHTFANARAFNQDISGWRPGADANTVFTSLSNAFNGAGLFNSNLGDWDVSRVTNFTNTFSGVSLSTANYEGLLIGWAAQDLQDVKTLDVGTAQYCSLAAATAKASIIFDDGWMVTDGGRCTQTAITAVTPMMRTVAVVSGVQASTAIVTATDYSPTESAHMVIIAAADTTNPEVLSQIKLRPRSRLVVTGVDLLEERIVDIQVTNSDSVCTISNPCEVTLFYTAADLNTLNAVATDLSIFHYTGSQWEELQIVDTGAMTITALTASFSPFALGIVAGAADTRPRFDETISDIPDRTYQLNTEITPMTLPEATGGNLGLNYILAPALPAGLSFDAGTRTISGTPTMEGIYPQTYRVTDADANTDARDSALLSFSITVESGGLTSGRIKQLNEAIMPRLAQSMLASTMTAVANRIDRAFSGASAGYQLDGIRLDSPSILSSTLQKLPGYVRSLEDGIYDWRQMLANSSFALPLQGTTSSGGSGVSVWGSSSYSRLRGKDNDLDWGGEVFSIQLGADKQICNRLLLGALVSWSDGSVDLDIPSIVDEGSYQHQMTSIHPYLAWSGGDVQLWGGLGYGSGELDIVLGRNKLSTNTRLLSLAAGTKGRLSQILSLKADLALARTDIKKTAHNAEQNIDSQRLRLLLEVQRKHKPISGGFLTSMLEVGLRYDGGNGASGFGVLVDAGMGYSYPATGLTLEGRVHTLAGRDDYTEWGLSGLFSLAIGTDGRGLALSLSPSYGTAGNGAEAIWQQNQIDSLGVSHDYQAQLDARLSYGLPAPGDIGLLLPYSEMTFGSTNSYRLGIRWQGNSRFDVNLFGESREKANNRSEHAVLLKTRARF